MIPETICGPTLQQDVQRHDGIDTHLEGKESAKQPQLYALRWREEINEHRDKGHPRKS